MKYIKMELAGIYVDPKSNVPIIVLKDEKGRTVLPIWIGPFEASSIIMKLEKIEPPRPMTHDLFINFLNKNNIKITKVVINELKDNTYYAKIHYKKFFKSDVIDARPSDAISLAIRSSAPLYVSESVIKKTFDSLTGTFKNKAKDPDYYKKILEEWDISHSNNQIM